jgi:hypothetical protein
VDAELVLDRDAADIVAGSVGHDLRDEEERDALRPLRRARRPGEDEVDDIVGEVVLAIGDEDFLAGDQPAAVARRLGPGLERADVRARLRFGQVHRAVPFAGDQLGQPLRLQLGRAVMDQRLDRAGREHHAKRQRHIGRAQILHQHRREGQRQALPAKAGRAGQRAPAALDIGLIGGAEAGRHRHAFWRPPGADLVAGPVQRRELARGQRAGPVDDRLDDVRARLREAVVAGQFVHADDMLQKEFLLGRRRPVARHRGSAWLRVG